MELAYRLSSEPSVRQIQQFNAWQAPVMPSLDRRSLRRWVDSPTWTPADTQPLVRHRSHDGTRWAITNDRNPPKGFSIEFDLGLVHRFAQPGTRRLLVSQPNETAPRHYLQTSAEGELDAGYAALGYVEAAPLPMLDPLELCHDPSTGAELLVAGPHDPLFGRVVHVQVLGFVEGFPIHPRLPPDEPVEWSTRLLLRSADDTRWRHRYRDASERETGEVVLGGLWTRPGSAFVPLYQTADGRLHSELLSDPAPRAARLARRARWAGAPLAWARGRPKLWALRASANRARMLATRARQTPRAERTHPSAESLLGYVRRSPAHGWSPIFSASHPALDDQYVTRSALEAGDMGYTVEGILGYVLDRHADRTRDSLPAEIKWASRFGQQRRYHEGELPGSGAGAVDGH